MRRRRRGGGGGAVSEVRGKMKNGFKKSVWMNARRLTFLFLKDVDVLVACA